MSKEYPVANFKPYRASRNPYAERARNFSAEPISQLLSDEQTEAQRGRWREYFGLGPEATLDLELGAYHGETSIELAKRQPAGAHLAVEWKFKQCFKAGKKARDQGLKNLTFLRANIARLPWMVAPGEVDRVWILFPDPWSKLAQQKWRLLHSGFFCTLGKLLAEGKELLIKTDHPEYAAFIAQSLAEAGCFDPMPEAAGKAAWNRIPPTPFERIFLRQGLPIHSFALLRNGKSVVAPKEVQEILAGS